MIASNSRELVIILGPQPPPIHGVSLVNAAVLESVRAAGVEPIVIDSVAPDLGRSAKSRIRRVQRTVLGLLQMGQLSSVKDGTLYLSVSGGLGQSFEIPFLIMARLRGSRVFLHHHSYAYLNRPNKLTQVLVGAAGHNAVHIALSPGMKRRLSLLYHTNHNVCVSNAVFLEPTSAEKQLDPRKVPRVLGFLGNISVEKGILDFINLMANIQSQNLPVVGRIAGPFMDAPVERQVLRRLENLPGITYVGPKYGIEKEQFLASIDVLIFPTHYVNEAEPLTIHEAMRIGRPVIAIGRGAIPEIVDSNSGRVVKPGEDFVSIALEQIEAWLAKPDQFQDASRSAFEEFTRIRRASVLNWEHLLPEIVTTQARKSVPTIDAKWKK